ncbi:PucR family transcriptional regulator [Pseudonocardia phyllosphaerae]|uniref:PucR family transcriptional regulator n=1 Tax=Pseudonocardia phyllosphaerae TaxID=3390502 RepID=UPI00397A5D33
MLPDVGHPPVAAATLRRLELASGGLAAACLAEMERRRPWFARLPAEQRAGVALVTQTGVASFVAWVREPGRTTPLTAEAFRTAPRDLARRISLRQTVELVRIAVDVFEQRLPPLAADERERHAITDAVLRFGREIAFTAATVYAGAAESRGAWDARLEALVVDAVLRGEGDAALVSRAAALGWDPAAPVHCLVGSVPGSGPESPRLIVELRRSAGRLGHDVLVGAQGRRLVVLLHATGSAGHGSGSAASGGTGAGGTPSGATASGGAASGNTTSGRTAQPGTGSADAGPALAGIAEHFGPGPVVAGPPSADLAGAGPSVAEALAGLAAAPGRPDAPRPVGAADLLPERALCGDPTARRRLATEILGPLHDAGGELLGTLAAYLEGGGSLEGCARTLYVHPNTVRYRLRRIAELTGRAPTDAREAFVLRAALVADRVDRAREVTEPVTATDVPGPGSPGPAPDTTPGHDHDDVADPFAHAGRGADGMS